MQNKIEETEIKTPRTEPRTLTQHEAWFSDPVVLALEVISSWKF